ncbi:phage tail protein I [Vreelandella sp. EE27]
MTTHLLPPNRSQLEARTAASHPLALPVPLRTLWNPATCPAELLPFLAWAFSVDVWEADWPDATKRAVIAESFAVHRIKGTRLAVEKALAAMGITVTLTEWFEQQPTTRPGTFSARMHLNDNRAIADQLSSAFYTQIHHAIQSAKNLRSHYDFSLSAQFGPTPVGVASAQRAAGLARNDARPTQPPLELAAGMATASHLQPASFSRAQTHPVQPPLALVTGLTVTASHHAAALTRRPAQPTTDATLSPARLALVGAYHGLAVTRRLMANAPGIVLPESVAQAHLPAVALPIAATCRGFAITHHTMESTT